MKKSRRFIGLVAFVLMLTLMIGSAPVYADQQETIVLGFRYEGEPNNRHIQSLTYDEAINQGSLYNIACGITRDYETVELLTVNGVPWQDSKYANIIREGLRFSGFEYNGYENAFLNKNPDIREQIVMDKRFNGWGKDVVFLEKQGKNVNQIKQIVSAAIEKKYSPGYIVNNKITDATQILGNTSKPNSNTNGNNEQSNINSTIEIKVIPGNRYYTVVKGNTRTGGTFEQAPFLKNGTLMIPVRGVFDQFGANITRESNQTVIKLNNRTIKITPNKSTAIVNGKTVSISPPATTIRGSVFVPLRFVGQQTGLNVTWNASQKYALIKNK